MEENNMTWNQFDPAFLSALGIAATGTNCTCLKRTIKTTKIT